MSTTNRYDKMEDYIGSLFNVFLMAKEKAEQKKDRRFQMISLVIYNYVSYMAKQHDISLRNIAIQESINLIPVFEYISVNEVELYDFTKINTDDVDITKKEDLERYVLTHVYYITQTNSHVHPHLPLGKVEPKLEQNSDN